MIRAFLVTGGLVMVATQQTPFDLVGMHVSSNPLVELSLCALVVTGMLASFSD